MSRMEFGGTPCEACGEEVVNGARFCVPCRLVAEKVQKAEAASKTWTPDRMADELAAVLDETDMDETTGTWRARKTNAGELVLVTGRGSFVVTVRSL